MQNINHGKYINYLILQSNSEIDVLHEGKGNSCFPEDLRQGMIKKRPAVLLCVSSIQIFIHLPIISSHFPLQDHFISFETYNWIKSAFSTGQKELHKYWWGHDRGNLNDRPLKRTGLYHLLQDPSVDVLNLAFLLRLLEPCFRLLYLSIYHNNTFP